MACRRASRPAIVCRSCSVAAIPMSVERPIMAVPMSVVRAIVAGPISVVRALVAAYPLAAPPIRCPHASPAGAGRIAPVAVPIRVASVFIAVPIWAPIVVSMLVSTAGERIGTRSHGVAAPGKSRPTVAAASTNARPAAYADMGRPLACARSTGGRGAQRRARRDDRRRGQPNRYLANHDAHSIRSSTPAFPNQTQQFPLSCSVRHTAGRLGSGIRAAEIGTKMCSPPALHQHSRPYHPSECKMLTRLQQRCFCTPPSCVVSNHPVAIDSHLHGVTSIGERIRPNENGAPRHSDVGEPVSEPWSVVRAQ